MGHHRQLECVRRQCDGRGGGKGAVLSRLSGLGLMGEVREPHASGRNVPGRRSSPCKGPGWGGMLNKHGIFPDNTEAVWPFKVPSGRGLSDMVLGGQWSSVWG